MADEALVGDDLKAMLRLAARGEMPFAFNPGKPDDTPYFLMHRIKSPEVLGRIAKKEGEGAKVTYGTISLSGTVLSLTCHLELHGTAKRLKRFLQANRLQCKVQVLNADGHLLEDDGAPAPEDDVAEPASADASEAASVDLSPYLERLRGLKAQIHALPIALADKLGPSLPEIAAKLKSGALGPATEQMDKLDAVLAKFAATATAAGAGGAKADLAKTEPRAAPPEDEAEFAALKARSKTLAERIAQIGGAAGDKLTAAFATALAALKDRRLGDAAEAMDKIEGAIARLGAAQKTGQAAEATREKSELTAPDRDAPKDAPPSQDAEVRQGGRDTNAKRDALVAALEPRVSAALSAGKVADPGGLRAAFALLLGCADQGDVAKAGKIVPRIQKMLHDGEAAGLSRQDEVGEDVKPFAISRLAWAQSRLALYDELERVTAAIRAACAGDPELTDIAAEADGLFAHLDALDARLEDKLDDIVNADAPDLRQRLKGDARKILAEYETNLNSAFFQQIDGENGFVPVAIASAARAALHKISDVLAA